MTTNLMVVCGGRHSISLPLTSSSQFMETIARISELQCLFLEDPNARCSGAFYELVLVTAVFHLLTLGMEVWAGTFFDDFPILSKSASAGQTEQHVSHLLNLIGLRFSAEGKKRLPFDMSMAVLGVVLGLSRFAEGVVSFKHTQPRRTHPGGAESLRGRLIWFEGFLFGRIVSLSLHEIGKRATALGHGHQLNDSLRMALVFFRDRIVNGRPIEITKAVGRTVSIFTDGAFEPTSQTPGTFGRHHLQ